MNGDDPYDCKGCGHPQSWHLDGCHGVCKNAAICFCPGYDESNRRRRDARLEQLLDGNIGRGRPFPGEN